MEQKEKKEAPVYIRYLWDDLTLEERQERIEEWLARKARTPKEARIKHREVLRYKPFEELDQFYEDMELEFGLQLDDGWFRLCALHKFEHLVFYSKERYEDDWLTAFSKNYKATRGMKHWPKRARSKANPYKFNTIYEVQALQIRWIEEHQQYKVVFQGGPGITQTFWFPAEFKDSSLGEGWVTPVYLSKFHPWVKPPRK